MPSKTRIEHNFQGDLPERCAKCAMPQSQHRAPRKRLDTRIGRPERVYKEKPKKKYMYVGLDGEGQGEEDHVYNMICASDETGDHKWSLESPQPWIALSTFEIFEWLLSLPENIRLYTFSFNYDITKIIKDLPNEVIYKLFRPETRQRLGKDAYLGPRPVPFGPWRLNMQGTKFVIGRENQRPIVIWDIWKFYQSKFTTACSSWKVGTRAEIELMIKMKDKRKEFDKLTRQQVRDYCFTECRFMAELAHKLVDAHDAAEIPLKNFYGAGSSASGMLKKMNIREFMRDPPEEMRTPVSQAFSGGRFDNRLVGTIHGRIRGADISSAYPYATQFLPCLAHGRWEHTKSRRKLDKAKIACVRYSLRASDWVSPSTKPWGPFPFREADGSICYPAVSGGGWVWLREFLEGERLFGNVEFREAWIYHQECDCKPFAAMPGYYNERCRIGKEGPGIVLKLAMNSVPGKTAQSVGSAPFQNWVWAGNINSYCRSQVLTALGLHRDWRDMLMVATDGILSTDMTLTLPAPVDTGTDLEFLDKGKMIRKPLGGWEIKDSDRGVFFARPGVYFPLNPSKDDLEKVRARGVGRGVVLENWERIIDRFNAWDGKITPGARDGFDEMGWPLLKAANVSRFCGAKSSISRAVVNGMFVYNRASGNHMLGRNGEKDKNGRPAKPEPAYGQWLVREVVMSFNPDPKRNNQELGEDGQTLLVKSLPEDVESAPYKKANESPEAMMARMLDLELNEQPDKDYADYDVGSFYD